MRLTLIGAALAVAALSTAALAGDTLDAVKKRGTLNCGVNTGLAGFSMPDAKGQWSGIDADVCRAVAAAVFGSGDKVKFQPYNAQQRLTAVQSGEIDLLARNTTFTLKRSTSSGLHFAPPIYYDGQAFMVSVKLGVKSVKDLNGATICVQPGTTTEQNLTDYFRANKLAFKPVVIQELSEVETAFFSGRCDAYTTDGSGLAATRAAHAGNDADYVILPEVISKEPLAPVYRQGDAQWGNIVDWTIYALFQAEEFGITKANVEQMKKSDNPEIRRMLGVDPGFGQALGLSEDWAVNIIKTVGNYGEMFERNVGKESALKLKRGLNAQWKDGGLIYAMPLR
jgi:general L-amino acid transport system substrate-binding protein